MSIKDAFTKRDNDNVDSTRPSRVEPRSRFDHREYPLFALQFYRERLY